MKTLVRAIAERLRAPVVEARIDPIAGRASAVASSTARPLVAPSPRRVSRDFAASVEKPRRGDGNEWPDTQPWCHP